MVYKNYIKDNILCFIIILLPYVEFISANIFEFDRYTFFYFIIFSILSILIIFIFFEISLFVLRKNLKIFYSILFFLLFKYLILKNFISNYGTFKNFDGEISISILILIFLVFIRFFHQINFTVIKRFSIIYMFLLILISVYKYASINKDQVYRFTHQEFLTKEDLSNISHNRNIYYVVLDGLTSLEAFEKFYGYKLEDFRKFITKEKVFYSEGQTAYPNTLYNFSSFLNLNYIIDENSDPLTNRSLMYPYTMRENIIKNYNLIKLLNKLNFELKWEGAPAPGNCYNYNLKLCLDPSKANKIQLIRNNFYVVDTFLSSTPIFSVTTRLGIYNPYNKLYDIHKLHDSIGNFLENIKTIDLKSKNYFFLIHHMSPHNPFVYNKDCSKRKVNTLLDDRDSKGYESSYHCALKKIKELYNFVKQNDPNSIMIFQADHGWNFKGDNRNAKSAKYYNPYTFNMIISQNSCNRKEILNKINMINTARLAISCSINKPLDLLPSKKYFTYPNDSKNFGKVYEIN